MHEVLDGGTATRETWLRRLSGRLVALELRWTAMQKEQSQLARGCREQGYSSKAGWTSAAGWSTAKLSCAHPAPCFTCRQQFRVHVDLVLVCLKETTDIKHVAWSCQEVTVAAVEVRKEARIRHRKGKWTAAIGCPRKGEARFRGVAAQASCTKAGHGVSVYFKP